MSRRGDNIHKRCDGRWEGRYIYRRRDDGKAVYKSVYANSYTECSEKLKSAKSDTLPISKPITVSQLFLLWLLNRKNTVKQSTYSNYKTLYNCYICDKLGSKRICDLNAFIINRFTDSLLNIGGKNGQGLSAITVQSVMIILRSVFELGELEYGLPNPAKNIAMPKTESAEILLFNSCEMSRIRTVAINGSSFELGILLSLYTGLRIGELCALTWEDIDLVNQVIKVDKTLYRIKNPDTTIPKTIVVIDTPKSKKSVRYVPIPTFMLPAIARKKCGQKNNNYFLTCSPQHTEPRAYTSRYKTFLHNLNISYRKFHSLRHTFATECIKSGVDVKTLSELLGHSSVKITLEKYVHSDMELKKRELEKWYASL